MGKSQLPIISETILKNLLSEKSVTDELILELVMETSDCLKVGSSSDIPSAFYRLFDYVKSVIHADDALDQLPVDTVLAYGKLWTILSLAEIKEQEAAVRQSIDDDAKQFSAKYPLFKTIRDRSGIAHDELARSVSMADSALSQFMGNFDNGKYFVTRHFGKRKYYYITDNGKALVEKMEMDWSLDNSQTYQSNIARTMEDFKPSYLRYITDRCTSATYAKQLAVPCNGFAQRAASFENEDNKRNAEKDAVIR